MTLTAGREAVQRGIGLGACFVAVLGLWFFAGALTGLSGWFEGRDLATTIWWALPGVGLALVTGVLALRVVVEERSARLPVALALALLLAVEMVFQFTSAVAPVHL